MLEAVLNSELSKPIDTFKIQRFCSNAPTAGVGCKGDSCAGSCG